MADSEVVEATPAPVPRWRRVGPPPAARVAAVAAVLLLTFGAVCGFFGLRVYRENRVEQDRALFLEVGKQGAVNLTTIDYQRAEADVQRILDSATGGFYDEFASRSKALIDVVREAQSVSVGTVTAAGVESMTPEEAKVLVALSVRTANIGAPEQQPPRSWRMRLIVSRTGDAAKISKVDFVP